jgi:hypothetical protein
VAEVHHWNYSKASYPMQVLDARNLVPVGSRAEHVLLHQYTSEPSKGIFRQIDMLHQKDIPDWTSILQGGE